MTPGSFTATYKQTIESGNSQPSRVLLLLRIIEFVLTEYKGFVQFMIHSSSEGLPIKERLNNVLVLPDWLRRTGRKLYLTRISLLEGGMREKPN